MKRRDDMNPTFRLCCDAEPLAAQFHTRRCACGAPAIMVCVGDEPVRQAGIRLSAGQPDRNLCRFHAGLAGRRRVLVPPMRGSAAR